MAEYLLTLSALLGGLPSFLMSLLSFDILEGVRGALTNPLVLIIIISVGAVLLLRPRVT